MVHKHKSFPVGKTGQRKLKKQIIAKAEENKEQGLVETPKPFENADLGMKGAHLKFLSLLGSNARAHASRKGGRQKRIDPLSLKQIADSLLRDIEKKDMANSNRDTSEDEDSNESDDGSL